MVRGVVIGVCVCVVYVAVIVRVCRGVGVVFIGVVLGGRRRRRRC